MDPFFQFESDFVESLRCIPMVVRYKLDTCGIKLKLNHWHQFTDVQRQTLVSLPCSTETDIVAYQTHLQTLIWQMTGESAQELTVDPSPPWTQLDVPDRVQAKAQSIGIHLSMAQWQSLDSLQRFALVKLSRSNHENHNFLPALREFELVDITATHSGP